LPRAFGKRSPAGRTPTIIRIPDPPPGRIIRLKIDSGPPAIVRIPRGTGSPRGCLRASHRIAPPRTVRSTVAGPRGFGTRSTVIPQGPNDVCANGIAMRLPSPPTAQTCAVLTPAAGRSTTLRNAFALTTARRRRPVSLARSTCATPSATMPIVTAARATMKTSGPIPTRRGLSRPKP
jgi:hypothetical protein